MTDMTHLQARLDRLHPAPTPPPEAFLRAVRRRRVQRRATIGAGLAAAAALAISAYLLLPTRQPLPPTPILTEHTPREPFSALAMARSGPDDLPDAALPGRDLIPSPALALRAGGLPDYLR